MQNTPRYHIKLLPARRTDSETLSRGSTKTLSSKDKDKVVGVGQGQYKDKKYKVLSIKYKQWVVTNIRMKSE